jgi:hypothetical protein
MPNEADQQILTFFHDFEVILSVHEFHFDTAKKIINGINRNEQKGVYLEIPKLEDCMIQEHSPTEVAIDNSTIAKATEFSPIDFVR